MKIYLSKLGREGLDDENGRRSIVIIDYAINLEHIGDIIEKGLAEQVAKKIGKGLTFSDDGYQELQSLFNLTIDNLRIAQTIFVTRDFQPRPPAQWKVKVDVRRLEKQPSERHLERLRDGRVDSLQTSSLHLDMLRDLKRINAHIVIPWRIRILDERRAADREPLAEHTIAGSSNPRRARANIEIGKGRKNRLLCIDYTQ